MRRHRACRLACLLAATAAAPAWAVAPGAAIPAATVDKADTAWMLVASLLVLMMAVPGLALFYGGLVRAKNMLSLLAQVLGIVCLVAILWVALGYSLVFTGGTPILGGLSKALLLGIDADSRAATFSNGAYIPEYALVCFQMTFACITPALFVGAIAERVRFWPLMLFAALWLLLVYVPVAHMVWYWPGPDAIARAVELGEAPPEAGLLYARGALDFAGGTVVHVNAGITGLVLCLLIGARTGFPREPMPPHSLTLTITGAALLWVGWFGFNAGSNLEANGIAVLAFLNTFVAAAAGGLSWLATEQVVRGKPSPLGAASGVVAGLVAVTPAAGFSGPMGAIVLGLIVSPVCFLFVAKVKWWLGYDDALDVFGVHCVGGIVGALMTAILDAPALGGQGIADYAAKPGTITPGAYSMLHQLWVQAEAVLITLLWSGIGATLLYLGVDRFCRFRASRETEYEGLDIAEHGERAYHYA